MPRERRRERFHGRTIIPKMLGDVEDRVTHDGEILGAVNTPLHHLLLYEPSRLDRANTRPSVARKSRDGRRPWVDETGEPGTDSGLRYSDQTAGRGESGQDALRRDGIIR